MTTSNVHPPRHTYFGIPNYMEPSSYLQKAVATHQHPTKKHPWPSSCTRSAQFIIPSESLARSGPASRTRSNTLSKCKNDTARFLAARHTSKSSGPASRTRSSTPTKLKKEVTHHITNFTDLAITEARDTHASAWSPPSPLSWKEGPASRTQSSTLTKSKKEVAHHNTNFTDMAITKARDTHASASSSVSWKEVSSFLDNNLMKENFIDHLCLTRINPIIPPDSILKANSTTTCHEIIEEFKLWPAVKFESLNELITQICRLPLPDPGSLCDSFLSEYEKLLKNITTMTEDESCPRSYGVVYFLGRGRLGHPPLVILEKEPGCSLVSDDINMFCFEDNCIEMAGASGAHCGSKAFQDVFNLAVKRTKICVYSEKKCFDVEYSDLARLKIKKRGHLSESSICQWYLSSESSFANDTRSSIWHCTSIKTLTFCNPWCS